MRRLCGWIGGVLVVACSDGTELQRARSDGPTPTRSAEEARGDGTGANASPQVGTVPGPSGAGVSQPSGSDAGTASDGGGGGPLPGPQTAAITLRAGANVFDLAPLGIGGGTIHLTATLNGNILLAGDIEAQTSAATGVRVVRPRFVLVAPNGSETTDPNNTFGSLDQSVPRSRIVNLGGGYFSMGGVEPGSRMKVRFAGIAPSDTTADGLPTPCKSSASFVANVVPQFKLRTSAGMTCLQCHGVGGGASAGLDLTKVDRDNITACANVLPKARSGSLASRPTGGGHAGGTVANATAYRNAISAWLANE